MAENRPRGKSGTPKIPRGTGLPKRQRQRAPKAVGLNWLHPPCRGCGGEVVRRDAEPKADWRRRATCSQKCGVGRSHTDQVQGAAERFRIAIAAHPACVICDGPMTPRPNSRETIRNFTIRATCSPRCAKKHHGAVSGAGATAVAGPAYRKGELVAVDFAGGFGGRQIVLVRPDPRPIPWVEGARSYSSVASGWLL